MRTIPLLVLLCGALTILGQSPDRPNVLFIVLDDLNEFVGFLEHHPQAETPNLDRLAARGTVFTAAYCNNPQCAPSRTSFLTGKDPDYTQIYQGGDYDKSIFRNNFDTATNNETVFTIPEVLREAGYYTKQIHKIFHGRNFFSNQDIDFDTSNVSACNKSLSWNELTDLTGFSDPEPAPADYEGLSGYEWGPYDNSIESSDMDYLTVDSALAFLEDYRNGDSRFCGKPFFLGMGLYHPHQPSFAAEKYFPDYYNTDYSATPFQLPYQEGLTGVVTPGLQMPAMHEDPLYDFDNLPFMGQEIALRNGIDLFFQNWADSMAALPLIEPTLGFAERREKLIRAHQANSIIGYLSAVRYADAQIGRVLDYLDDNPAMRDNTLIVLFSDHGYSLGEKRHWKKFALWENDIRVPLVIVDPSTTGGQRVDQTVSLLDVFPTLLDRLEIPAPTFPDGDAYLDGSSLKPFLHQPDKSWTRPVLTSVRVNGSMITHKCFPSYSVRDNRWHYIRYRTNGASSGCDFDSSSVQEELYEIGPNREIDPHEWENLALDSSYRDIIDYLSQWLPDGPLFNQEAATATITNSGIIPCAIDLGNSYFFQANLTGPDGLPIVLDSTFSIRWQMAGIADHSGKDFVLNEALFDSLPASGSSLTLKLIIEDAAGVIYPDIRQLETSTYSAAELEFDLQTNSDGSVEVINFDPPSAYTAIEWDFGDGYVSQQLQPYPHKYAAPGSYVVSCTLTYGNSSAGGLSCTATSSEITAVDSASFDPSVCQVATDIFLEDLSAEHAEVSWPNAFGATSYVVRFAKNTADGSLSWTERNIPAAFPTEKISNLRSNTEYIVQVMAGCDAAIDSSDWSAPLRFCTSPCASPINLGVDSIGGITAELSWQAPHTGDLGYEVVYYPVDKPRKRTYATTFNPDFMRIGNFEPEVLYGIELRTMCKGNFGYHTVKSDFSDPVYFRTATPTGMEDLTAPAALALYPNPTRSAFVIEIPGNSSEMMDLTITSITGNVVYQTSFNGQLQLEAGIYPPGLYLVTASGHSGRFSGKLIILE